MVWAAAVVAAVLIGIFALERTYTAWFGIALAACTVGALCIQLATREKQGFIDRLAASVAGAFVVLAIASGVFVLLRLG